MSTSNSSPAVKRVPDKWEQADKELRLANCEIRLEERPAGVIGRIDHDHRDRVEYAGPLPAATVDALRRVANRGDAR